MKATIALTLTVLTIALPLAAAAQGSSDLQLEMRRKRAVVLPKQSSEQIKSDADRAVDEYAATRGPSSAVKETSPVRPPARPDLGYDVKGGIQTQRLNDALRNR